MIPSEITFALVEPRQDALRSLGKPTVRTELGPLRRYPSARGAVHALLRLTQRITRRLDPEPTLIPQETSA